MSNLSGRSRWTLAAASLLAVGLVLTACSNGGSGDAGATAAPKAKVAEVKAAVDKLMTAPSDIGVSEPLKSKPTGKLLIWMACDSPICTASTPVYKEAAAALGMKFQVINTGSSPTDIGSAFDQAVAAKPDALIEGAIAPQLFQDQLQKLVAGGTKVVLYATAPPDPKGITAVVYPVSVFSKLGNNIADFIYADNDGKAAKVLYVNAPEFPALKSTGDSLKKRLGQLCSGCTIDDLNVNSTEIGSKIPGRVVSYLQQHPDTDYVLSQFGDLEIGVPQAVKAAGITNVKLIAAQGSSTNFQAIKDGGEYADLINFLPLTYWQAVDIVARALAGQDFTVPEVPAQWLTKSNLTFDPSSYPPFGSDYEAQFKTLWGVS